MSLFAFLCMNIRLEGTELEISQMLTELQSIFSIGSISKFYLNRSTYKSGIGRIYLNDVSFKVPQPLPGSMVLGNQKKTLV